MKALEIGCGPKSRWIKGTEGVDLIDFGQKYVGDFLTYEFKEKYDTIFAHHLLEHIPDTIAFFNKVGQVLKPWGTIDIRVPIFPFKEAFVDPTHVKFIVFPDMFIYFTKDSLAGHCYSNKEFKITLAEQGRFEWEGHITLQLTQ